MRSIRRLLGSKGPEVWTIAPEASVFSAIELMAEKRVGALVVLDGDHLTGIVSERDYARKVILKGKSSRKTPTRDIMTTRVLYASPDKTIEECMALMTNKLIRHLPILEEGKLVGIVSIGDLVRAIIDEQQFMIEQLEAYING